MNAYLSMLIKRAHRENRLAAVHMDLQNCFLHHNDQTSQAFENVRPIAAMMRRAGITNNWVAFHKPPTTLAGQIFSVGDYNRRLTNAFWESDQISPIVEAQDDETVLAKNTAPGLDHQQDMALDFHLDTLGADTVLIDGVSAFACLGSTIRQGILKDRYNFVAIIDGIDLPAGVDYARHINTMCAYETEGGMMPNRPLHTVTARELATVLGVPYQAPILKAA